MAERWRKRDFDQCECGDYRHQHRDGTGACTLPNDLSHGFKPCSCFRLAETASELPEWANR